jgi:hypothetical protein
MSFVPKREAILTYFADKGMQLGRDYTYGGLRPEGLPSDQAFLGIEMFNGAWRTYDAQPNRKTDYKTWPSFIAAAEALVEDWQHTQA